MFDYALQLTSAESGPYIYTCSTQQEIVRARCFIMEQGVKKQRLLKHYRVDTVVNRTVTDKSLILIYVCISSFHRVTLVAPLSAMAISRVLSPGVSAAQTRTSLGCTRESGATFSGSTGLLTTTHHKQAPQYLMRRVQRHVSSFIHLENRMDDSQCYYQ